MNNFDKIAGKTKEAIAEIIGDGELAREGRAQENHVSSENAATPKKPLAQTSTGVAPAKGEENTDFDPEKVAYYP